MYTNTFNSYTEVLQEIEAFQHNVLSLKYTHNQEKNVKFIIKCLTFCMENIINDNVEAIYNLREKMLLSNLKYEPGYTGMQYRKQCQIICNLVINIYEKEQEAKVLYLFRNEETKTLIKVA